jgi:pyrroline-5-carboxylate reductase
MSVTTFQGRVGFIGAGNMGSALIHGYLKAGLAPDHIQVFDADTSKLAPLAIQGIQTQKSAEDVVRGAHVVVLAVKPGVLPLVLGQVKGLESPLWLSLAAGVTTAAIEANLGEGEIRPRVVRAMPNTPALVLAGATAIAPGKHASDEDLDDAETLMAAVGSVVRVEESLMDAVTGLSGSGPAFVMMFIEALADAGVHAGLPRKTAQTLAAETVRGAAELLLRTGKHPGELKDQVASPGGTTIAGLAALEEAGFRAATIAGVLRAFERARELSKK